MVRDRACHVECSMEEQRVTGGVGSATDEEDRQRNRSQAVRCALSCIVEGRG